MEQRRTLQERIEWYDWQHRRWQARLHWTCETLKEILENHDWERLLDVVEFLEDDIPVIPLRTPTYYNQSSSHSSLAGESGTNSPNRVPEDIEDRESSPPFGSDDGLD